MSPHATFGSAAVLLATLAGVLGMAPAHAAAAAPLPTVPAQSARAVAPMAFDGVVEAVRQTVVAAQVAGAVVQLDVKVGDRVKAGQLLARIDARAAEQGAVASDAQVAAARASLDLAAQDLARQQQLARQNFISPSALERAEAQFKATQAQVNAQLAQAGAARTQTGWYLVRAPYDGVVSEVPVVLGDMALPGRALVTVYDPAALRIAAAVPQTVAAQLAGQSTAQAPAAGLKAELPGLPAAQQWPAVLRTQWLPTVDPSTHTMTLRADLPAGLPGVAPGQFARLWLPVAAGATPAGTGAPAISVPRQAVVRRAELTALYVLDGQGRPLLRQVRLGRVDGDRVEVLSGLAAGEAVVTDPQAAARASAAPAR